MVALRRPLQRVGAVPYLVPPCMACPSDLRPGMVVVVVEQAQQLVKLDTDEAQVMPDPPGMTAGCCNLLVCTDLCMTSYGSDCLASVESRFVADSDSWAKPCLPMCV